MTAEQARRYCAQLARSHYENFHVASFLLPADLHQDFYNVYSYCRWADDLGDETGDAAESTRLLRLWQQQLEACYPAGGAGHCLGTASEDGKPAHPVFLALGETIRRHQIPPEPFGDLITAFLQDQRVSRYATYAELLDYCRYSANPVGRLVLYVCGYRDPERQRLSDSTCTALQQANFWQDVGVDLEKGRVYIPLQDMARFGYSEQQLLRRQCTPEFRNLMRFQVERTRELFGAGQPLAERVNRRLAADIELFTRGGLEILRMIEQQHYDVLSRRPALSRPRRFRLLAGTIARRIFGPFGGPA